MVVSNCSKLLVLQVSAIGAGRHSVSEMPLRIIYLYITLHPRKLIWRPKLMVLKMSLGDFQVSC